jgi:GH25 family lysozyme M1 (1,4-beta-N-acetylmuramidase)
MCWKKPMRATGIDISKWDVSFSPPLIGGPQFVIQRASYGLTQDPLFEQLYTGVVKVPVRGAYHYMSSGFTWTGQANFFLDTVKAKDYHFYVCDFEGTYNVLSVDFAAAAIEWMRHIQSATGKKVLIYSNISTYQDYLSKDSRIKEFPLWIAWPPTPIPDPQTTNPRLPIIGWTARLMSLIGRSPLTWTFWQYSFGEHNMFGKANGVGRTGCDVDVFNGTYEELCNWAGVNAPAPIPLTLEQRVKRLEVMHDI